MQGYRRDFCRRRRRDFLGGRGDSDGGQAHGGPRQQGVKDVDVQADCKFTSITTLTLCNSDNCQSTYSEGKESTARHRQGSVSCSKMARKIYILASDRALPAFIPG